MRIASAAPRHAWQASMKVPPKRKGNQAENSSPERSRRGLNESPSEKEGKSLPRLLLSALEQVRLNESPSEKEGKSKCSRRRGHAYLRPQ